MCFRQRGTNYTGEYPTTGFSIAFSQRSISVMDRDTPKILVIADQALTSQLSDYALKVAVRLDLEIVVLFLLDKVVYDPAFQPRLDLIDQDGDGEKIDIIDCNNSVFRSSGECSGSIISETQKKFEREAADFAAKAWKAGIKVSTVLGVGGRERAIAGIRECQPEIRFLLTNNTTEEQDDGIRCGQPILKVLRQKKL